MTGKLAAQNHYPPISILDSLSRLMPSVDVAGASCQSHQLRALLSAYAKSEDLIRIGAYSKGADPVLDNAIAVLPELQAFLRQGPEE